MTKPETQTTAAPRAQGAVTLSVQADGRLDRLRQSASLKVLFPRHDGPETQAVLVNTAGGATGGDHFSVFAEAQAGAHLVVTTQAAERAYRAQPGQVAQVRNRLFVQENARLDWLPQEMLLFDGSAMDRRLSVDLAPSAELLMAETLVFGRTAMGESVHDIRLCDRIEIRRKGKPLFLDQIRLTGDAQTHLSGPTLGGGARAVALLLYVSPKAEALRDAIHPNLPSNAGASLIGDDMLVLRALGDDSYLLRQTLVPALRQITGTLPKTWNI